MIIFSIHLYLLGAKKLVGKRCLADLPRTKQNNSFAGGQSGTDSRLNCAEFEETSVVAMSFEEFLSKTISGE